MKPGANTLFICAALLAAPFAVHAENAYYDWQTSRVTIPLIDAQYAPLGYHDAVLEFNGGDAWRLTSITQTSEIYGIKEVRLIQTDTFPVQVFLEVNGTLGSSCGKFYLDQHRVGDTFDISIQRALPPPYMACLAVEARFSWLVRLDVYGLPAGEYKYTVNKLAAALYDPPPGGTPLPESLTGSFLLEEDNAFDRTAPDFPYFINPELQELQPTP